LIHSRRFGARGAALVVLLGVVAGAWAGDSLVPSSDAVSSIAPATPPIDPNLPPKPGTGIAWDGVVNQSLTFLALEHSFRLLTEPGTRQGLNRFLAGTSIR